MVVLSVWHWTCDLWDVFNSQIFLQRPQASCSHMYVPLLPSNIIWYQETCSVALQLGSKDRCDSFHMWSKPIVGDRSLKLWFTGKYYVQVRYSVGEVCHFHTRSGPGLYKSISTFTLYLGRTLRTYQLILLFVLVSHLLICRIALAVMEEFW